MANRDPKKLLMSLDLVVCENLEQLDAVYELGVSLLRHATQSAATRYVGFSASLSDPSDLAAWLDVDPMALYSFQPKDRDQSLTIDIQTFTIPHSPALFKIMTKRAHAAIKTAPEGERAVVFVPSYIHCRTVARDLITECALQVGTERGYLSPGVSDDQLENYLTRLQNPALVDSVSRGVGIYHEGLGKADRRTVLELYAEGILCVLIVSRVSCWTLPVKASVVVVMGTQYLDLDSKGSERQLCDYLPVELLRMQSRAIRYSGSGRFYLFCPAEAKDTLNHFLYRGLPLESQLLESHHLQNWYSSQKREGKIANKQEAVEALALTFLAHRVASNPSYYDASSRSQSEALSRIVDKLDQTVEEPSGGTESRSI
jgi:antiviral helicase SLH1